MNTGMPTRHRAIVGKEKNKALASTLEKVPNVSPTSVPGLPSPFSLLPTCWHVTSCAYQMRQINQGIVDLLVDRFPKIGFQCAALSVPPLKSTVHT